MQATEAIKQQMFHHIEQWQQSGLSQKQYCGEHHLRYHVFHYWYKRYRQARATPPEAGFLPLQLNAATLTGVHSELVLVDGRRLLFYGPVSADYFKALLA